MRIVDRNKVPAPECCDSLTKKIRSLILPIKRTDLFGLSHPNVPIRTRGQWTNHDDYKQIKFALLQLFEGRCAYCEMEVSTSGSAIECFRPRSGLTATKTGKFYPLHHAWLEFAWENLYLSCIDCSKNKGARFPIAGEPCELLAQGHELDVEDPLLLDPCDTRIEISDHLEFTYSGMVIPRSNRGEVTIKLLKLNSHYLINKRKEDWYWKSLQNGYQVSEPIRDYLPPSYNKKARTVYEKMTSSIDSFKTKVFEPKIEKIELFNIGPLKGKKTIQINAQGQDSWLMILGDNGAGKSTILKAITLVLLGRDQVAELIHKFDLNLADLVNYLSKSGTIKLKFSDEFPDRTLTVHKNGNLEFSDTKHFPIIFNAYGSSRLAPTKNNPSNERQSSLFVDNLFNHFSPLSDSQDVLNNLSESERFYAARCLSNLFELDSKLSLVRRKDRNDVVFEFSGRNSTYNQLSDGFKSIVTLFLDILTTAKMFGFESAEQFNGIVLIDELGTHLHPKWRIKIVRELRSIFTHAQFICTTHEPLCLRGLNSDEIVVLKKEGNKSVKIISELPKTEGMSCEQLLTSVHFGLHSTTDLELNYKFARYYELLAGDSESDECKAIESELSEMGVLRGILGGTRREQLVYRAIDKLIAQSESTDIEELIDSSTLTDELSALWKIS